jgi:hypothetical protein
MQNARHVEAGADARRKIPELRGLTTQSPFAKMLSEAMTMRTSVRNKIIKGTIKK